MEMMSMLNNIIKYGNIFSDINSAPSSRKKQTLRFLRYCKTWRLTTRRDDKRSDKEDAQPKVTKADFKI